MRLSISWREAFEVSAELDGSGSPAFVMAPGAGGNFQTPFLKQLAADLATRDFPTLRFNFPYTERKRSVPDPAPVLEECYRAVVLHAAKRFPKMVIGGKSMGGRIASQMIAKTAALEAVRGLIFLGYPLHPPGKPEKLRDAHLYDIKLPMLFVEGTRDAFATPSLLNNVLSHLPTAKVHWIEGGDHSFKVSGRKPADVQAEILSVVAEFLATLR